MNFEMINLISRKIRKTQRDSKFSRGQKDRLVTPTTNRRKGLCPYFYLGYFLMLPVLSGTATQGILWSQPEVVSVYGQMDDDYDGRQQR